MRQLVSKRLAGSLAGVLLVGCGGGAGQPTPVSVPVPAPVPASAPSPAPTAPAAPQDLAATPGNQQVGLSWSASAGAASYELYQGSATSLPAGPAQTGITGTSTTVTGLANGTTYTFVVRAVNAAGQSGNSSPASATPAATTALGIASLELAQTHVLPETGKRWTASGRFTATEQLHFTGGREALALLRLSASDAQNPALEGLDAAGASLGTLRLAAASQLPKTEANGPAYGSDLFSVKVPSEWMAPGVALRVKADNYLATAVRAVDVGGDFPFSVRILPFYLFGATDGNSGKPLSQTGTPPIEAVNEMFAKWPVASLSVNNHPAARVSWPTLVIGPRSDSNGVAQPAYVMGNASQSKDGFAALSAVLGVLSRLKTANGEAPISAQYYAPLIMLGSNGGYVGPGGGLGGLISGGVGAGDDAYAGIYIHEQGHAFGLPHAGEAYDAGSYPYDWGSLKGSAWGYDAIRKEFLAPFVPSTASRFAGCSSNTFAGHARAVDDQGRCVKQDPMQSGSGDQASGARFATFSDFNTAVMQRYFEGVTTLAGNGSRSYSGGRVVSDAAFASGYKRWDTLDKRWVEFSAATTQGGIFGLNQNLPVARNVPVHAVAVTISNAGTAGATFIYPPFSYSGNRLESIDPTVAADRARIVPDTGTYFWYCRNGGCDYTVRATYAGGAVRHQLIQGGFRPFNQPSGTPPASASTATDGDSFESFVLHFPADAALSKVELLSTPMVWQGMPATPAVLATWQ